MSRNNGKSNNNNRNEPKARGNPKQLCEKYKNQARELLQAGDRMQAEYYLQFADHYHRVANEMRGPSNQSTNGQNNNDQSADNGSGDSDGDGDNGGQQQRRRNNNRRNHRNRDGSEANNQNQNAAPQNAAVQNTDAGTDVNADAVSNDAPAQEPEKAKPAPRRVRASTPKPDNAAASSDTPPVQDTPVEVHPELNLGDAVAEKPVRRRAPVRRKKPEATASDATPEAKPSSGGEAA